MRLVDQLAVADDLLALLDGDRPRPSPPRAAFRRRASVSAMLTVRLGRSSRLASRSTARRSTPGASGSRLPGHRGEAVQLGVRLAHVQHRRAPRRQRLLSRVVPRRSRTVMPCGPSRSSSSREPATYTGWLRAVRRAPAAPAWPPPPPAEKRAAASAWKSSGSSAASGLRRRAAPAKSSGAEQPVLGASRRLRSASALGLRACRRPWTRPGAPAPPASAVLRRPARASPRTPRAPLGLSTRRPGSGRRPAGRRRAPRRGAARSSPCGQSRSRGPP